MELKKDHIGPAVQVQDIRKNAVLLFNNAYTLIDTQNGSGLRLEDGGHSQSTGDRIQWELCGP